MYMREDDSIVDRTSLAWLFSSSVEEYANRTVFPLLLVSGYAKCAPIHSIPMSMSNVRWQWSGGECLSGIQSDGRC